ncbi:MAG: recombinase family protein [Lachnospiraceae bacterium]
MGIRNVMMIRHKIEIDTYAANVVKDIFRMKLQGMSQDAIARRLNESEVFSALLIIKKRR